MALLKFEYNASDFDFARRWHAVFPELRAKLLGHVGYIGKEMLRRQFLMGQEINLRVYPIDAINRRTVAYKIGKRAGHVKIGSYPMNLFERGRKLRSGKMEKGKNVIRGKFKRMMESNLQGILERYDKLFLDDCLKAIKLERKMT